MKETKRIIDPEILKILLYALGGYLIYNRFFGKKAEDREAEQASDEVRNLPIDKNPLQTETFKPPVNKSNFIAFRTDKTSPSVPKTFFVDAARDIKESFGVFNDDEARIIRSIKRAKTQTEVNIIARSYSALFRKDLFFDLNNKLNKTELAPIYTYILKLPAEIPGRK